METDVALLREWMEEEYHLLDLKVGQAALERVLDRMAGAEARVYELEPQVFDLKRRLESARQLVEDAGNRAHASIQREAQTAIKLQELERRFTPKCPVCGGPTSKHGAACCSHCSDQMEAR